MPEKDLGYGQYGYTAKQLGFANDADLEAAFKGWADTFRHPESKSMQDFLNKEGFEKRYQEDPDFRKRTKDARTSGWDKLGNMVQNVGDGAVNMAEGLAPIAAATLGGAALSGMGAGAGVAGAGSIAPTTAGFASNAPVLGSAAGGYGGTAAGLGAASLAGGPNSGFATPGASTLGSTTPASYAGVGGGSLGGVGNALSGSGGGANALKDGANALTSGGTDWMNWLIPGSSLASGLLSYDSTENAMDEIGRQYDQTRADFAPYREAGYGALDKLTNFDTDTILNDPMYQLARDEGLRAVNRGNAARGLNLSGNALIDEARTGASIASNYGNNIWNRQAGLAGVGQAATGSTANAGQNASGGISNAMMQQGQGINNAIQGGISNYLTHDYINNPYWRYS